MLCDAAATGEARVCMPWQGGNRASGERGPPAESRGRDPVGSAAKHNTSLIEPPENRCACTIVFRVWNVPTADVTSAPSLSTFRKRLKLHLFPLSYPGLVL